MRDAKYDIVKAIAIYLVIVGHVIDQIGLEKSFLIRYLHMPVFFFVSGFFLYHTIHKYTFREVFIKKAKTLLTPYIIWSFISFGVNVIIFFIQKNYGYQNLKEEFIEIFLYARSLWFFIMMFFSSIFLAVFAYTIKNKYWILICVCGWFLVSMQPINNIFLLYKFKWLFPFMLLGYLSAKYKKMIKGEIIWSKVILNILGFILVAGIFYNENYYYAYSQFDYSNVIEIIMGLIYYAISFWGIVSCLILAQKLSEYKLSNKVQHIGASTADIYVIHSFFIKLLIFPAQTINILSYLYVLIVSFVILVISMFVKYIFRYSKIYNFSFGRLIIPDDRPMR